MNTTIKFSILVLISLFTTVSAIAKGIKPSLMITEFVSPELGNFVETYINVNSKSIIYAKNVRGKFQGSIAINLSFSRNDSVYGYKNYNLLTPEYNDTSNLVYPIVDVQRFLLKKGDYKFDLIISDNNNINKPLSYSQQLIIDLNEMIPTIASIELVDSYKKADSTSNFSKNGYDIVPHVSSFFPENMSELTFYSELYGINRDIPSGETFILNTYLESIDNKIIMQDFFRFNRYQSASIIPILGSLNIKTLPSGNYNLVIEVRNKENMLVADQRIFIRRSNPNVEPTMNDLSVIDVKNSFVDKLTRDTLTEFIKYLRPISSRLEVGYGDNTINSKDALIMQQYFLSFWQKRNPANPEGEWKNYYVQVKEVNRLFKTQSRKGYATDRGRVYLQYGKPDSRLVYDREPSLYPYEIWQYYKLNNRSNRRFVFTNTDLVTNNYSLIHSDALGEVRDDRWQTRLNKRSNMYQSFDQEKAVDQFGTNLRDAYDISR